MLHLPQLEPCIKYVKRKQLRQTSGEVLNIRCSNILNKGYSSNDNFPELFNEFSIKYSCS